MTKYLLETSTCSYLMANHARVKDRLTSAQALDAVLITSDNDFHRVQGLSGLQLRGLDDLTEVEKFTDSTDI